MKQKLFKLKDWILTILMWIFLLCVVHCVRSVTANELKLWEKPCRTDCLTQALANSEQAQDADILTECCPDHDGSIIIMSWNMKRLGNTKISNPDALLAIVTILGQSGLIAVQEVTNQKGNALATIERRLDQATGYDYSYVKSPSLGPSSYKEQYAFFYRSDLMYLKESYVAYNDKIDRPPMVATFIIGNKEITLVNIHTDPNDVTNELLALEGIVANFNGNVITLGDFNASCSYYDEVNRTQFMDDQYTWLITNGMDTNVAYTTCTYDRMIITNDLKRYISWAEPFRFDKYIDYIEPERVSDHWPIIGYFNFNR